MKHWSITCGLAVLLAAVQRTSLAASPSPEEVRAAFSAGDGLAVEVGANDSGFLGSLTNRGKRLVQGLTLDDATRDQVRAGLISTNLHPLASVSTWYGAPRLPYADRLVNLLILDRDMLAAKAPSETECRRVVAPGGAILARTGGAWTRAVVARPAGFADWTHFDGGPDGNAVSADAEATGLHGLQWIDNVREVRWQKTGPHGGDQGNMRILGRVDPQAHRIEASNGGNTWAYVADARIGLDFAIVGDRVVIGTHDGWVHGLDLKTGGLKWRYFVAPAHRLIIANGMLTSAWPVFGVTDLGSGQVVASAGTHVEMDGGVRVVALQANDGALVWAKTITKTASKIPPGGKGSQIVEHSLINAAPSVVGGKVIIDGGAHLGRLEFDPAEPEASITKRLSEKPPAKKR